MIPNIQNNLKDGFEVQEQPSKTFKVDFNTNKSMGYAEHVEAVKQAIFLILSTERYTSLIHSWNYGVELKDLFGQPPGYVLPELKRRITEALTQDDRILSVDAFNFDMKTKGKVSVSFTVKTKFGEIITEKVVSI